MSASSAMAKVSLTPLQGFDGLPLMYPVPLFVRNTFIDHATRSPSLDGFFEQRLVASCPTSIVSDGDGDGAEQHGPFGPHPLQRVKTCPENIREVRRGSGVQPTPAIAHSDTNSECSTVDTAEEVTVTALASQVVPAMDGRTCLNSSAHPWNAAPKMLRLHEMCGAVNPMMPHMTNMAWQQELLSWCPGCPAPQPCQLPAMYQPPPPPDHVPYLPPGPVMQALLSIGSAKHQSGDCKPCAFLHSKGCESGVNCEFCHLCQPGEKKRRQKEKRVFFGSMRQLRQFVTGGPCN